jgi:integrase
VRQNRIGAKRAIEVVGELAQVIERIGTRKRERLCAFLVEDDNGRPLSLLALRGRFDKARAAAAVWFQFRDIRAKTASDTGDLGHSQRPLGHKNRDMTEHYVRERIGQSVKPLRQPTVVRLGTHVAGRPTSSAARFSISALMCLS